MIIFEKIVDENYNVFIPKKFDLVEDMKAVKEKLKTATSLTVWDVQGKDRWDHVVLRECKLNNWKCKKRDGQWLITKE